MLEYIPIASEAVDLSTSDHTFVIAVHSIRVNGEGVVTARLKGDRSSGAAGYRSYTVAAGAYLPGQWESIRRADTTATGIVGFMCPFDKG